MEKEGKRAGAERREKGREERPRCRGKIWHTLREVAYEPLGETDVSAWVRAL